MNSFVTVRLSAATAGAASAVTDSFFATSLSAAEFFISHAYRQLAERRAALSLEDPVGGSVAYLHAREYLRLAKHNTQLAANELAAQMARRTYARPQKPRRVHRAGRKAK